ncbi:hypothetical protein BaRGS_00036402 [Batillaria attramentaria]|uniref:Uncharacterized protein n=1 Tax=Batillaria attramentaria TaxID=370345 RepID=A0ABD0JBJ6_9CAEN
MGQLASRQELINQELSNPAARDWLCVSLALRDATRALAASMHTWIARVHRRIKRAVPGFETCSYNCSQKFSDVSQWCATCLAWQREISCLCENHYAGRVVWSRFRSQDWPDNPYEVARVFIPRAHRFYYKSNEFHEDIRYALCFLENCTAVEVPQDLIQKSWVLRNSFKRRGRMRAKKRDMQHALSVLIHLLQLPQISEHEAVLPVLQKLRSLQTAKDESSCTIL